MLQPLSIRYEDIKRNLDALSHLMSKHNKRSAWFSAVGTVFKHIFGTLDEDDAEKYDNAINSFQNKQIKIASLMKENILITKSVLQSFNDTLRKIEVNEAILK